jgi:hypothetical protein
LLRQAIAAEQEYIGQMIVQELRDAIEEPAARGGWELERGLVDVLLQDIGAHTSQEPEPGALPLLSHACSPPGNVDAGELLQSRAINLPAESVEQ